jgi:hypothetical protein
MENEPASSVVVAEMNTHAFMFRGAGRTHAAARDALLNAWRVHRSALLARYPERADTIPEASGMEAHFKIHFLEFAMDAGYRDGERIA